MKILFLSSYVDPGTGASILIRFADRLRKDGHEVQILTTQCGFDSDITKSIPLPIGVGFLGKILYKFIPNYSGLAYFRLLDRVQAYDPDVINIHWTHGRQPIPIQIIPELNKKYPLFWTIHDLWPITGNSFFEFTGGETLQEQKKVWRKKLFQRLEFSPKLLFRYKVGLLSKIDIHTISPSMWLQEKVCSGKVFRSAINHHVPNGVDVDTFKPLERSKLRQKYGVGDNEKIILFLSSNIMDERKGFYFFVKSLEYMGSINPQLIDNTTTLLIGDKSREANRFLPTNVKNLGSTRDLSKLVEYYNLADVFVSTSLADNFPSTSLESIACGTPVVAFDVGGISEIVIDRKTGLLSRSKDIEEMARNIQEILTLEELRKELSVNCRCHALSNLSMDKFVKSYVKLFDKAICSHNK